MDLLSLRRLFRSARGRSDDSGVGEPVRHDVPLLDRDTAQARDTFVHSVQEQNRLGEQVVLIRADAPWSSVRLRLTRTAKRLGWGENVLCVRVESSTTLPTSKPASIPLEPDDDVALIDEQGMQLPVDVERLKEDPSRPPRFVYRVPRP